MISIRSAMRGGVLAALLAVSGCSATTLLNAISTSSSVTVERGIAYGEGERRRYDVYRPAQANDDAPVAVFVYGGSWDSGSRGMYAFVGNALARQGIVTAIPDYTLYPDTRFPGFVDNIAAATAAVSKSVAGGRPVVLVGHSAGAQIGALVAFDERYLASQGLSNCRVLGGFVGLAGPYDFLPLTSRRTKDIFPEATRDQSQPINYATGRHPPSLLLHGADDTTVEPDDSRVMGEALRRAGNTADVTVYPGTGHADLIGTFSPVLQRRAPALADTVAFIRAHAGKRGC